MQTKTQGCGCGCGGGRGGCGCASAGAAGARPEAAAAACSPCETAAFVRPRFFAGQLLTEDDLGALVDYTLAKQRFHNTRLYGAGVVCGLAVACGARGSSKIVVEPGAAIDGCGNDVVLSCARTLDLAPMIRELLARQHGACSECSDPGAQTYDLYVRYVERADQPVAAYPVGDACDAGGAPSCEATRILEGVTFELRCPPSLSDREARAERPERDDRQGGAREVGAELLQRVGFYAQYQRQLVRALERAAARSGDELDAEELEGLREASVDLHGLLAGRAPEQRLRIMGQYLTRIAGPLARVQRARLAVPADVSTALIAQNATRAADAIAIAMCEPAVELLPAERMLLVEAARLWQEASGSGDGASPLALRHYLGGAVATPAMIEALGGELAELVERLRSSVACRDEVQADCALREQLDGLAPRWSGRGELGGELAVMKDQLGPIVDVLRRFAEDRRRAALEPPCAEPGDTAVRLARIEVADRCKVVRIDQAVRAYVLAPAALRHWGAIQLPDGLASARAAGREAPAPDAATLASELAELRRTQAILERRLGDLELELAAHAARTAPPPTPAPPAPAPKGAP